MATRTYLTSRFPGTNLLGPLQGNWSPGDSTRDVRGLNRFTFLAPTSKVTGGVVNLLSGLQTFGASAAISAAPGQRLTAYRWVTERLDADVTVSGTLTITLAVRNTFAASLQAAAGACFAYVTVGDSMDLRAVLVNNLTDATNWTATTTYRMMTFAVTSGDALAGDRLVIEFGSVISPPTAPAGDSAYAIAYGTTNASHVALSDATNGGTSAAAAWAEWSTTLSFAAAPAAPPNDACTLATVISALPYTSPAIDATTSTDTDRSVWWTWTAPVAMRVFVVAWGSNFFTQFRGWQGSCASRSLIHLHTNGLTNSNIPGWLGTGQAFLWFDAQLGTQYWFQLSSGFTTSGPNTLLGAKDSGGSAQIQMFAYALPGNDDLYVNCQRIVAYDGTTLTPKNFLPDFYNDTPTNSCIDYTHAPLDNLNGGVSTGLRLYVDLFGDNPLVEILDLNTLNVGEQEIDFISAALNYAGHSENLASIVMGGTPNLHLGYFGDNYSVRGGISTANACRVNRINATHADNQPGAPFSNAEAFVVTQDVGGSDYGDLTADANLWYYTSSGTKIFILNLTTLAISLWATLPAQPTAPRPGARGIRLLAPYDGTGGALVAYGDIVYRLNSVGTIIASYTPAESSLAQDMDKIELTSDGTQFWVSDQWSTHLFKFDIVAGTQLATLETRLPPGQLCGFTIVGYRGVGPPPPPPPNPPPPGGCGVDFPPGTGGGPACPDTGDAHISGYPRFD